MVVVLTSVVVYLFNRYLLKARVKDKITEVNDLTNVVGQIRQVRERSDIKDNKNTVLWFMGL